MSVKTVLITGANKGIGYETARRMGALGYDVWLGCRDPVRGGDRTDCHRMGHVVLRETR